MSIYIKNFGIYADYENYIESSNLTLPNISLCDDTSLVYYLKDINRTIVTCDDKYYNGETLIATNIVVTTIYGKTLINGVDYTISNNNGGINAGDYTFTINGIGKYRGLKNATFTINENSVNITIELSQDTYTYDGNAKEPTVTVKNGDDIIDPSEYTVTYSNNTNAGTASVIIADNTAGNYNVSGVTTFTINKAQGSVTTAPTAKTRLISTGSAQELINAGSGTGTMMYNLDGGAWSSSIPTAINAGSYTIGYKAVESENYTESTTGNISVTIEYDPYGGHDYVEIGGLKWATMNIGASSITECGLYFAWGETQGYTADQIGTGDQLRKFSWDEYKYCNGTKDTLTKYNGKDGKGLLESSDDAATVNWNNKWRTPTQTECQNFISAVNVVWTDDYNNTGVSGMVCTAKTDSSKILFLPDAGYYSNGVKVADSHIKMWTGIRSVYDGLYNGLTMDSISNHTQLYALRYLYANRCCGLPIRPVAD